MKGRKLLSAAIAGAMVLGTMSIPVFADDVVATIKKSDNTTTDYTSYDGEAGVFANVQDGDIVTFHTEKVECAGKVFPSAKNVTYTSDYEGGTLMYHGIGNLTTMSGTTTFKGLKFDGNAISQYGSPVLSNLDLVIDGCTFNNAGGNCVYITAEIKSLTVTGCTFTSPESGAGGQYLVWPYNAHTINITNNTFTGNGTRGAIHLGNATDTATVSGNTINSFERGVQVALSDGGSVNITENTFSDIKKYSDSQGRTAPIFIHNATNQSVTTVSVTNNDITDSSAVVFGENSIDCISEFTGNTVDSVDAGTLEDNSATYAAKIGDKGYATLADAVAAAQDGDTVTLVDDVTESIEITNGQNITLDLNGKTLTNTAGKNTIENRGTLVVEDSSQNKTAKVDNITNGKGSFVNYEGGVATLNGGSFDRSLENGKVGAADGNSYYTIKNWGIMTINENVSVNNNTNSLGGSSAIGNGYYNGGNFDNNSGVTSANVNVKLTINGGKFTGGVNTIKNDDWAQLEINDGVFENNTQHCILNCNVATINGGIFTTNGTVIYNKYYNDTMDKGTLEITGGKFNGEIENDRGQTNISGGTFTTNVSAFLADGYKLTENADGTYGVVNSEEEYAAKIGDTKYASLQEAYDNAKSGDTIYLLTDIAITKEESEANNRLVNAHRDNELSVTFDLGGHTISFAEKTENMSISGNDYRLFDVRKNNCITITNGTINLTNDTKGVCWFVTGFDTSVINLDVDVILTPNSGICYLGGNAANGCKANINGGTYTLTDNSYENYPYVGIGFYKTLFNTASGCPFIINGGTFVNFDPLCQCKPAHYTQSGLGEGKAMKKDGGTFTVIDSDAVKATITRTVLCYKDWGADGTKDRTYSYTSLADAVADAQNGDTVELLYNADGNGVSIMADEAKDITIDLGGYTYTVSGGAVGSTNHETQGLHLEKGSKITIKNGKITSTVDSGVLMLVQNYCDLTLENVTLDGSNLPGSKCYVLSNNCGNTVLTGNTNIVAKAGDIAFDVCRYTDYPSVTVTLDENMTGTINGNIELSDSADSSSIGAVGADRFNLIIKAGTVKGAINDLRSTTQKDYADFGAISGGTFTTNVSAFLADGYKLTTNDDGTYGVVLGEEETKPEILKKSLFVTYSELGKFDFGSGEADSIKLSFFAGVDSLNYSEVGFDVTLNGKTQTFPITIVYDSVKVNMDGNVKTIDASEFGKGVNHIFGQTINFPATSDFENASVKWVPYAIRDKVKITGNTFELSDIFPGALEVSE